MIKFGFLLVCAYAVQGVVSLEGCVCTLMYNPVCGSDGVTYGNPCDFDCANKVSGGKLRRSPGECHKQQAHPAEILCACPRNYDPICGTDGNTYNNKCLLDCAKFQHPNLDRNYSGPCQKNTQICACPKIYLPVCGTDGKSYSNKCLLNCAKTKNPKLETNYPGPCQNDVCVCPHIYRPVCGTDGKTYGNDCSLNCAKSKNPNLGLQLQYQGPCQKNAKEALCACHYINRPVCGSDGKTYPNECVFNCKKSQNNGLELRYQGECM